MLYFEDFEIGLKTTSSDEYLVTKVEILEFGRRWDPAPYHADEEAATASIYGGLIAPGPFILAIRTWLLHRQKDEEKAAAMGLVEMEELRFHSPVRPGDRLSVTTRCLEKRELHSKPNLGLVSTLVTLANQKGETVLTLKDKILVAKRPPAGV